MIHRISLNGYDIDEHQFANLASEFFGDAKFPAGNHFVAHVNFSETEEISPSNLRLQFLNALESYKRKQTP